MKTLIATIIVCSAFLTATAQGNGDITAGGDSFTRGGPPPLPYSDGLPPPPPEENFRQMPPPTEEDARQAHPSEAGFGESTAQEGKASDGNEEGATGGAGIESEQAQPPSVDAALNGKNPQEANAGGGNSAIPALDGAESLLGRNPFGNSPAGKSDKDKKNEASLELTCACFVDGKWNFVITDIESKVSYAVVLKGRISDEIPYRVDFFDEDTMSVVVSNSISEFVITLKSPDEPAPAPPPPPKAAATAQKNNQQSNRQNRYRMWFPPQRVEVPKAKRINWR